MITVLITQMSYDMFGSRLRFTLALLLVAVALNVVTPVFAGDSPFGYVYTTDTHGAGEWEIEQWITDRQGQAKGDYNAWLYSTEVEYGVTDNLQTALYLNYDRVSAYHNRTDSTTGPGAFIPDGVNPDTRYTKTFFESVSNEWIYRILSPYKDPIGLALYLEPSYGDKKRELEGKIILQKNFFDDRLVWAANLIMEYEKTKFHGPWEKETELQFTTGLSYRFLNHWNAGVEYRRRTAYEGFGLNSDKRVFTNNYVGPSLHYANKDWWVTVTYLTQLGNAKGYTDDARANIIGGRFYGEDAERREIRLRAGFSF